MTYIMTGMIALSSLASEPAPSVIEGWVSGYAPGVFEETVAYRHQNDVWRVAPPVDWYVVEGYWASTDCSRVGSVISVRPLGATRWSRLLVGDCMGDEATMKWMIDNNIVGEVDGRLWEKWTEAYGRPLRLEVKY